MPYEVESDCPACHQHDRFTIGHWPVHLGLFLCPDCRRIVNIPLDSGQCVCSRRPQTPDFYDYTLSIPHYHGELDGPLQPGPICPRCAQAPLSFQIAAHVNYGRLGQSDRTPPPWRGRDYLEKAIFCYALVAAAVELKLDLKELLAYYNIDPPASLLADRRISVPIYMDIEHHLVAAAGSGEASFSNMTQLLQRFHDRFSGVLPRPIRPRPWWRFW